MVPSNAPTIRGVSTSPSTTATTTTGCTDAIRRSRSLGPTPFSHRTTEPPYLAPELQLLFKSKDIRPNTVDAITVIPALEPERRTRLASFLPVTHPWQTIMAEARARRAAELLLGDVSGIGLLAGGNSSQAWTATHDGKRSVVRVPIPNSGRLLSDRSEARIGALLSAAGHPVSDWTLVEVDDAPCCVGPLLDGTPVAYGEVWTDLFAADLAAVLHDLHQLTADGFGPLENDDTQLRGRSATTTEGIVDHWFRAAIWPFDQTTLEKHPIVSIAADLVEQIASVEQEIREAAMGPNGVVHSDLHREHLLIDGGRLSGALDFGDAFVGSTAWDFSLLHWYYGDGNTRRVAVAYPSGHDLFERGRVLALAVGCYKLAKNPDDPAVLERLRTVVDGLLA